MAHTVVKHFKVWWKTSMLSAQSQLLTNASGLLFLLGKLVRFLFFFVFLFSVLSGVKTLSGLSRQQVIFIFLIFNLIDIFTQFLFRGVYQFRFIVVSGNYDLDLLKPITSFFRPIFGSADILDFLTLFPLVGYIIYFASTNHFFLSPLNIVLFILFFLNAILISFAFHLTICAICILTLQIDHLIWVYRDLTSMARFPTDIYPKLIQYLLTFTIPVIIIFTVPIKSFFGILSWQWAVGSFVIGGLSIFGSLKLWKYAIKNYMSASS